MKTYRIDSNITIHRVYFIDAESEKAAIKIAQENPDDYEEEEMDDDWSAEEQ